MSEAISGDGSCGLHNSDTQITAPKLSTLVLSTRHLLRRLGLPGPTATDPQMLTLYSYPALFGVADNNGYGLKVFAFLRIAGVPFRHEHIFDASKAPRGQLPYIVDGNDTVGDSETILGFVTQRYRLTIDAALNPVQRTANILINRLLDDLYWVMSYSRWQDERFWPAFCAALLREHPSLTEEGLAKAQAFNHQRYYYQGIGRFDPDAAMARGVADLGALATLIPSPGGMCMARTQLASMRPSTASSPTSIFTTSIRR